MQLNRTKLYKIKITISQKRIKKIQTFYGAIGTLSPTMHAIAFEK